MKFSKTVLASFVLLLPLSATARPPYLREFRKLYPNAKTIISCTLCHGQRTQLNYYGQDFEKAGLDFKAIEILDSDGDGHTNSIEIAADTFPGDKQSHPTLSQ